MFKNTYYDIMSHVNRIICENEYTYAKGDACLSTACLLL